MQADLDRLNGMIGQVLELTRFELQENTVANREVDLKEILNDLVESANYEGRGAGKIVSFEAPVGVCLVMGDDMALRSCVENILRNAVQHSPADGLIEMVLLRDGDRFALRVDDSGPGVPEELLPRLFAPFFRVPGASAWNPHGSGLGLSISARVVARHGGEITAVNRSPHGLSVRLALARAVGRVS
jgi:two-component system sensor histidine kinase CpxA